MTDERTLDERALDARTLDDGLRARIHVDAAAMAERLQARGAGAQRARARGARRRRAARAALATCTALLLAAVGLTARSLSRQPASIEQRPVDTTPTTAQLDVVGTTSTTQVSVPSTVPPITVAPDPSGTGAMPVVWAEVPGDVAGLGITGTASNGVTYSLFDAAAAESSGDGKAARASMAVARTQDGESWERLADVPWATELATAGPEVLLAGAAPSVGDATVRVRLAGSTDGGRSWEERDIEAGEGVDAPVLNPIPGGVLTPLPPFFGPNDAPSSSTVPPEARYGSWMVPADQVAAVQLAPGAGATLAVVGVQRSPQSERTPRCAGGRDAASVYWYVYRDGITIELRPFTGGFPTMYAATVVAASTPPPDNVVRCTVEVDAVASAQDRPPETVPTELTTTVLRRDRTGWVKLDSDLPDAVPWRIVPLADGFIAESRPADGSAPRHLRSADGERWEPFAPPRNWPERLGQGADAAEGRRAIGTDAALGHVATSLDGGETWTRVDLRALPVPNGPTNPTTVSGTEARASANGFVVRYTAAEGNRFWRLLATSRDGRTWSTFDESPLLWTGNLGPRLALAGDTLLMTTNDSAPIGGIPANGGPLVIGFTTRSYVGRPTG